MAKGLPYDSDEGRNFASTVTSLMHGEAYAQSSRIAELRGPFAGYSRNEKPMLRVIAKHKKANSVIPKVGVPEAMRTAAKNVWAGLPEARQEAWLPERSGHGTGSPTGTIGFMMDCDTTGIEPDIALIKYKKLVGGGMLKIVNQTVPLALEGLGYHSVTEQAAIGAYLEDP